MPKIGVEFRKRYIIEAKNETQAIRQALALCKADIQKLVSDEKRAVDELFKVVVIASEIIEGV